jgi:hypothetical protein
MLVEDYEFLNNLADELSLLCRCNAPDPQNDNRLLSMVPLFDEDEPDFYPAFTLDSFIVPSHPSSPLGIVPGTPRSKVSSDSSPSSLLPSDPARDTPPRSRAFSLLGRGIVIDGTRGKEGACRVEEGEICAD